MNLEVPKTSQKGSVAVQLPAVVEALEALDVAWEPRMSCWGFGRASLAPLSRLRSWKSGRCFGYLKLLELSLGLLFDRCQSCEIASGKALAWPTLQELEGEGSNK